MNSNTFETDSRSCVGSRNGILTTIPCCASFSEQMNCSFVSSLTLDYEPTTTSDPKQNLSSVEERRWSSEPTLASTDTCMDSHRYDRFSSCSNHGDKMLCPIPQRTLSTEFPSPSSSKQATRQAPHNWESPEGGDYFIGNVSICSDDSYADSFAFGNQFYNSSRQLVD